MARRPAIRWHIAVFLAPAVLVYSAIMILPLFSTLNLSLFTATDGGTAFVGLQNFRTLFGDPRWSSAFWNALGNNLWFFAVHMLVQNPIGILLAALLSQHADLDSLVPENPMSVDRLQWEHIQRVLSEHDGNISATARALGMHRRTLQRKLQKRPVRR